MVLRASALTATERQNFVSISFPFGLVVIIIYESFHLILLFVVFWPGCLCLGSQTGKRAGRGCLLAGDPSQSMSVSFASCEVAFSDGSQTLLFAVLACASVASFATSLSRIISSTISSSVVPEMHGDK
jgi:hypothetical protein